VATGGSGLNDVGRGCKPKDAGGPGRGEDRDYIEERSPANSLAFDR
jgi:hypothetical protein